jgi:2-methylisocitrate lyase-like PEP mutase family enzyme
MREGNNMISFRASLAQAQSSHQALTLPGAYDALSARLIQAEGFSAVYLTGAGLANSMLGVPDIGLVTAVELRDHVARISETLEIPLVVDGDTGFGNAVNTYRTVRLLERAGASAIQIEDQVFPKKCGHFAGKAVISAQEMVQKVHAAVDARENEETVIIARTDVRAISSLEEAFERAELYREAGADVLFVEAPESVEELAAIGSRFDVPLIANMVEGGKTPLCSVDELSQMGFSAVLFANAALRVSQRAMSELLRELHTTGSTNGKLDVMATWEERQSIVGKPFFYELEIKYATKEQ